VYVRDTTNQAEEIMKAGIRRTVLLLLLLFAFSFSLQAQVDKQSHYADTITIPELKDHMFFLASDYLEGRVTGTPGYKIAAQYCVSQLRSAGVEALVTGPSGDLTFLQEFLLRKRSVQEETQLIVRTSKGYSKFKHEESFKVQILNKISGIDETPSLVFVGYGIEEPDQGWNDFDGVDVEGKAAIMLNGVPTRDGKAVLPQDKQEFYTSRQGRAQRLFNLAGKKPAAIIVAVVKEREETWPNIPSILLEPNYSLPGIDSTSGEGNSGLPDLYIIKWDVLKALCADQVYNPAESDVVDLNGYKSFDLKDVRFGLDYITIEEDVKTCNVVGIVRGTDPALANQFVTIGAHLDHVPPLNGAVCNGADDNASGVIGVLEVAEAIAMAPPRRSVLFVIYTGEENNPAGCYGSRYFVNNCPVPIEKVIANINLDMIGRSDPENKDTRAHYISGFEGPSEKLLDITEEVNDRMVHWPLKRISHEELGGDSDHSSFHDKGIPAMLFFSGDHEDLHKPTDDAEKIDFDKMQKISQLVYDLAMELADQDEPLSDVK
jgi:hypothetical protein